MYRLSVGARHEARVGSGVFFGVFRKRPDPDRILLVAEPSCEALSFGVLFAPSHLVKRDALRIDPNAFKAGGEMDKPCRPSRDFLTLRDVRGASESPKDVDGIVHRS